MHLPPGIAAAIDAGDTVIASSARAARALRRLHGEAQRARGFEAWVSADILDWESWLNRLWQQRLRSGSESRLLLTPVQEQQIWVRQVKPSIEGLKLISVRGVAELAQQAYALLCAYRALDFLSGERMAGTDVETFRGWARDFERTCKKEGWFSREMLAPVLRDAVLAGQLQASQRLLLIGFDRITPAQLFLVDAFRQQGYTVELAEYASTATPESALLVQAVGEQDEIRTCALWVRSELALASAQDRSPRIGIVVPNVARMRPEIARIFRRILAPETVAIRERDLPLPFEFSLGVPLADVPMVRAALLLLRWMDRALLQDQASWLTLSGFLCPQPDDLLPIAEFDAWLRRQSMRPPEQDLDTWLSEGSQETTALGALRRRLRTARRLLVQNTSQDFAAWTDLAREILEAAGWPGWHEPQSEDFQVEARWSQLFDTVAALAFDGRQVNYADFLEVLEHQAGRTIFSPESRDAPVQILGPLEAAGLTFDALWFLGADDAAWPAVARPHPFLSQTLQRKHGMPHASSDVDWQLAQQVTTRLEKSAAKCVFSYAAQNAEGACRPSTLFNGLSQKVDTSALRISIDANEDSAAEHVPVLLSDEEPATVLPWPTELDAGGAEVLKRQAACAFQAFATRRLAARPMEETDWGLEARERGSTAHEVLETLWAELKNRDRLTKERQAGGLHSMVEEHVAAALKQYRVRGAKRSWSHAYLDAEQERIVALLEEWLAYEAKRADFTVEAGEKKLLAEVGDLKLHLRVDRIDAIAEGRVILDYKTGVVKPSVWEGPRPDDPQLPLYAAYGCVEDLQGVLLASVRAGEVKVSGCVENSLAVMPGDTKLAKTPYRGELLEAWRETLLDLGRQFLRGEAQVDPKQYPKTCEFCPLPGLCRIAGSERANAGGEEDDSDGDD